ncbi:DNA polymerase III subunit delta [Paraurantiacibacter namhicola]|uniref:DNA-directed DNA polymerase n=1 Tax=Paraurantiacibacter namhicola TaxID=645517 RepID=A0A1C7D5V3_9SPHN|nr:DNA polymerase III subunit delta [Paraurantiacibacter namhicola]ANU06876.1 DNA polymerase III subunit delta [Paraurantiacibacter namhicola]
MKLTQRDFRQGAARAASECRIFFFCGPDEAGASAAANAIAGLIEDPGERVEFSGADMRSDPVRLVDEARSSSLFGDKRHLFIRASGEEAHEGLKLLTAAIDMGEGDGACPVLVHATSATDKSRTAKLLAGRKDALVAMFYPPDLRDMAREVRQMAGAAGLTLSGDIAERIARGCGLDARLAQSEVTKLALYLGADPQSPKQASVEALEEIGAVTEEDGFQPVVDAVLGGQVRRLPAEIARMRELSLNPVGLLLAMERRAAQLAGLAGRLGRRPDVQAFMNEEKQARRIFFKDQRALAQQLERWRGRNLERLVDRLTALHRQLLTNSQAAELLLAQELTQIARFAARKR